MDPAIIAALIGLVGALGAAYIAVRVRGGKHSPPPGVRPETQVSHPSSTGTAETSQALKQSDLRLDRESPLDRPTAGYSAERNADVAKKLRHFMEDATRIYDRAVQLSAGVEDHEKDISYGEEHLSRWKARVVRYLDQNISEAEARSFLKRKTTLGGGVSIEHLASSYEAHRTFLLALVEELANHSVSTKVEPIDTCENYPTNPPFTYSRN